MLPINQFSGANKIWNRSGNIKYVVMHYTAGTQSKKGVAYNVCAMWNASKEKASADYVVDDGSIWRYSPNDNVYTGAVGGSKYYTRGGSMYGVIKNNNSISVEMCSSNLIHKMTAPNDSSYYFTNAVIQNAVELAAHLLLKHNLGIDKLYRHYDVTGKLPLPIDKTELLTRNGWKNLGAIRIGDEVMTYDYDKDRVVWGRVIDKLTPWVDTVIARRGYEATKDHRTLYRATDGSNAPWKIKDWGDMLGKKTSYELKVTGDYDGAGLPLSIDYLRFLVWVQADGHYIGSKDAKNPTGIEFHFKKQRKIDRVIEILKALELKYDVVPYEKDGSTFIRVWGVRHCQECEKWLTDKRFSWNLFEMNEEQFNAFFDEIFLADGSVEGSMYFSSEQDNLDFVQALFATRGKRCRLGATGSADRSYDTVRYSGSNYSVRYDTEMTERKTDVTCVTVPTGMFMMRQNGQTFITGNCPGIIGWNGDSGSDGEWAKFKIRVAAEMLRQSGKTEPKVEPKNEVVTNSKEELDMTIDELTEKIDNKQSATIGNKYRAFLNETKEASTWAKPSWDKATSLGVVDGTRPHDVMTREEFITVLGRLGMLEK